MALMPSQSVSLPEKAEILSIQFQRDDLCMWYKCDPHTTIREERYIHIYATGAQTLPDNGDERYITTVQQNDGEFIWHIYEAKQY
jgi:hypothetical protein